MGLKETEDILRSQVTEIYHGYCLQVWKEALDATGVNSASELRNPENVFYPMALRKVAPINTRGADDGASISKPDGKSSAYAAQPIDKSTTPVPQIKDKSVIPASKVVEGKGKEKEDAGLRAN